MRFLVDECVGSTVAKRLKELGFEVVSIFDDFRGATDEEIIIKCQKENYILVTSDKDFGEMVFKNQSTHNGIVLLRCEPNNYKNKIEVLEKLIKNYSMKLSNNFVVVTNKKVRIIEF